MKRPDARLIQRLDSRVTPRRHEISDALGIGRHFGWIATARRAAGLSAADLANRLGVSQPAIAKAESNEAAGRITIANLERVAHALDCELVYGFVPSHSFAAIPPLFGKEFVAVTEAENRASLKPQYRRPGRL